MVHTRETRAAASEIKFVIAPALAPAIRDWARAHLRADPHGAGPFEDEYETASLYFDTAALDVSSGVDPTDAPSTGYVATAPPMSSFSSASCASPAF